MRILRAQQLPATSSRPGTLAPARQGPLQTFLTPDPLHWLVIDAPTIKPQPPVDQAQYPTDMAPLGIAVLTCQPACTPLGNPESILQNHDGSSHREVHFAALRRSGLRSFPSHRKVRLTAQQAPTASPGLRLEHGLVEFCVCQ